VWSLLAVVVTIVVGRRICSTCRGRGGLTVARRFDTGLLGCSHPLCRISETLAGPLAIGALLFLLFYWGFLAWAHHAAYQNAEAEAVR